MRPSPPTPLTYPLSCPPGYSARCLLRGPPPRPLSTITWSDEYEEEFDGCRYGWEWHLDHGYENLVPVHRVYEGDEDLTNPRTKNEKEILAAKPHDVNDILVQMVRIAEHLKRSGHHGKSWNEVRLRLRDPELRESDDILRIEEHLTRRQGEVFWEMSRDGHKQDPLNPDNNGHFLRAGRGPGGWCFLLTDKMWLLSDRSPRRDRFEEILAAKIKSRRAKINKCRRRGAYQGPLIRAFESKAKQWEDEKQKAPNGTLRHQLEKDLEKIFEVLNWAEEALENERIAKRGCWEDLLVDVWDSQVLWTCL